MVHPGEVVINERTASTGHALSPGEAVFDCEALNLRPLDVPFQFDVEVAVRCS